MRALPLAMLVCFTITASGQAQERPTFAVIMEETMAEIARRAPYVRDMQIAATCGVRSAEWRLKVLGYFYNNRTALAERLSSGSGRDQTSVSMMLAGSDMASISIGEIDVKIDRTAACNALATRTTLAVLDRYASEFP